MKLKQLWTCFFERGGNNFYRVATENHYGSEDAHFFLNVDKYYLTLQKCDMDLYSHQSWMKVPISPHLPQHCILSVFLVLPL